jgi:hypothetical protein
MSSAERVKTGRYTEADVLSLYMTHRESEIGPFTREVGDFIAHKKRDRGATLDTTAYMFAQLAFFQTYQSDRKTTLNPRGDCGWWLRHYLLTKTKDADETLLKRNLGLTKKQAKNAVKSWFEDDSAYPSKIKCGDPRLLYAMAGLYSQTIIGKSVFTVGQAKAELSTLLKSEDIEQREMERFLVATAVLLKDKSVEIVPGFAAKISLTVGKARHISVDEMGRETAVMEPQFVRPSPDGNLTIFVTTENRTGDGLVGVGLDFLDTEVDTEQYFARTLVSTDEYKIPRLHLDKRLSFDTAATPPVNS